MLAFLAQTMEGAFYVQAQVMCVCVCVCVCGDFGWVDRENFTKWPVQEMTKTPAQKATHHTISKQRTQLKALLLGCMLVGIVVF